MAYATIAMTNGVQVKQAPIGFSWTVFFWGGWVPLIRQDWMWGILLLLACIFTYGIAGIVVAFFYNKSYLTRLFNEGYYIHALPQNVNEEQIKNYLGFITLPTKKA